MKINPTRGNYLVREARLQDQSVNGLLIPGSSLESLQRGVVEAIGLPELSNGQEIPLEAKTGDIVFYRGCDRSYVFDGSQKLEVVNCRQVEAWSPA